LLDARVFMDADLAEAGIMVAGKTKIETKHLAHGVEIARESARLDVGQGVIVSQGTVLAVEAFEGTNAMIERSGSFGAKQTLFVKTGKPSQDTRFDVPVFGLKTLETMTEAKLSAAALEAGSVLILDKPAVLAEAKRLGIGLIGFE